MNTSQENTATTVAAGAESAPAEVVAKAPEACEVVAPKENGSAEAAAATEKAAKATTTTKTAKPGKKTVKAKTAKAPRATKAPKAIKAPKAPRTTKAAKGTRHAIPDAGTIRIIVEGNPRREGTGRHAAFAVLRRFDGKSVEAYAEKGGSRTALRSAVRHGWAKVEA